MSNLHVSPEALHDLSDIKSYISDDLENPKAARSTVDKILKRIRRLVEHPLMGAALSSVCDVDTDERFLVCGNYLAFYHVSCRAAEVYVDRVLYGGRDYMRILFGSATDDPLSDFLPH